MTFRGQTAPGLRSPRAGTPGMEAVYEERYAKGCCAFCGRSTSPEAKAKRQGLCVPCNTKDWNEQETAFVARHPASEAEAKSEAERFEATFGSYR